MIISICLGIGLATACGLRVFIPLLVVSLASHLGYLPLSAGFHWMSSTSAVLAFSVAAGLEVAGYYIPWMDHLGHDCRPIGGDCGDSRIRGTDEPCGPVL